MLLAITGHARAAARALDSGGHAIEPSGRAPVVSPDGTQVYTGCDGICLWVRDAGTGLVSFAGRFNAELTGSNAPALSADGAYLYAIVANGVAVFSRNATTGALTLIQQLQDGIGGVDGLGDADQLLISPDGAHVYVAGQYDGAVAVFSRNGGTGMLNFVEAEPSQPVKSFAMSADGANLYVAYSLNLDSSITVFTRDAGTGALALLETETNVAVSLDAIAVSPDGAHVYAGPSSNASGAVYARSPATGALTLIGPISNLLMAGSRSFLFSADGLFLYAHQFGVRVLARDPGTGALTSVESEGGFGGDDPSMALSPDGANLYSSLDGLTTFTRDAGTGQLTIVQVTAVPAPGVIAVSPDGANIYVAGTYVAGSSGSSGLAASYARDAGTGQATFLESHVDGYGGVHDLWPTGTITVSPDGAHVYIGGPKMGIYGRDAGSGRLTLLDAVVHPFSAPPSDVTISADGAYLYTLQSSALTVLARDAGTGALTTVESEQDGVGGVDGLAGASSVAISHDGSHVYVAGESLVGVFARNAATGHLTFVETVGSPLGGLELTTPLAITPDGAHVYVMGYLPIETDAAIAVFAREPATGHLTFVEYVEGGRFGVPHILPPLHVSPDGELVFADTSVFAREAGTGRLAFVDMGHSKPFYLTSALSPDGAHLYSGSFGSSLWTTFVGFEGCNAAPMPSCRTAGASAVRIRSTGSVTWRWLRGAATAPSALGDPLTATHYALCVYQGGGATLAVRALGPANMQFLQPQWSASGAGFKYRDTWRTPEGLLTLVLTPGAAGSAKVRAKGAGPHLDVPALPLALPVRVQLQNSDGECWESTYTSSPNNSGTVFVGRE